MPLQNEYDNQTANDLTLDALKAMLAELGATTIHYKSLAPNDNYKNQIYLGGDFSVLQNIPASNYEHHISSSKKSTLKKGAGLIRASVKLTWLTPGGERYPAPNTKLILYPQYTEVRLSGFVQGCAIASSLTKWMNPDRDGRSLGRVLFLAKTGRDSVIAYLAVPGSRISNELYVPSSSASKKGLLTAIPLSADTPPDNLPALLTTLNDIHERGWVPGTRLNKRGELVNYKAPNGGGYTLEAMLGVRPNSEAAPDYLGWEIKSFNVTHFANTNGKALTLMTPEPDGGYYITEGLVPFLRRYGHTAGDRKKYFTGIHRYGEPLAKTNLTLSAVGLDTEKWKVDAGGMLTLTDENDRMAASWSFAKLLEHWVRKHNFAAYVPVMKRKGDERPEYLYSNQWIICQKTDFTKFMQSITSRVIYYDPASKVENLGLDTEKTKRRNQFRIKSQNIGRLYEASELMRA